MLSKVGVGLVLLAVPGVVITALVVGAAATLAFEAPLRAGLPDRSCRGADRSGDLIPLFERLRVRPKVVQTVVAESALNDPTGAVLAVTIAAFIVEGDDSVAGAAGEFLADLGLSVVLGAALGLLLALVVSERQFRDLARVPRARRPARRRGRVRVDRLGGWQRLPRAFIAGVIVGNSERFRLARESVRREIDYLAGFATHVVVLLVFLVLGANLPLGTIADEALPALRSSPYCSFSRAAHRAHVRAAGPARSADPEELTFLAWTRETVVPASIAGLLVAQGVPAEDELVTVVALAVIVTLVLQATTKGWLARRLGLLEGTPE